MEETLLIFINILVLASVNALVLIFISIRRRTKTYFLGWSLLIYSLFVLVYFLWFHAGWILKYPHLIRSVNPLMFLTAPFFYFYIRNTIFDRIGLDKRDIIHFLPALLHVLDLLPFYLLDYESKLALAKIFVENPRTLNLYANGFIPSYWVDSFRLVLMAVYIGYSFRLLFRFHPNWVNPLSKNAWQNPISVVSFLFFLITLGYISYHSFWMAEIMTGINIPGLLQFFTWVTLIGIAMLSIYLHLNPEKIYGLQSNTVTASGQNRITDAASNGNEIRLDNPEHRLAIRRIDDLLTQKQVFLRQDLKVGGFADMAGVNSRDLGVLIQKVYRKGFRELINQYRINCALEKIKNGYLDERTIEALGHECGFNNRITFFNVFKKMMGIGPQEYWIRYQNETDLPEIP